MKHDLNLWYSECLIAETALITPLSRQTRETCTGSPDNVTPKYGNKVPETQIPVQYTLLKVTCRFCPDFETTNTLDT
jgi:hypothetical protein